MRNIVISSPKFEIAGDVVTIRSDIELPGRRFELYFRGSAAHIGAYGGDAFLVACLPTAMKLKVPVIVESEVSPQLLRSVNTAQDILVNWYPDFAKVDIQAKLRMTTISVAAGSAVFFSGGVDSFYTAYKQLEHLSTLVLVHGFDVDIDNLPLREKVSRAMKEAAAALGKPLIEIETNSRKFTDDYVSWPGHQVGCALAAVALLLGQSAGHVFIPASNSYAHMEPNGTHALLDPLWSAEYLTIIHDGAEYSRNQKVAKIARHPEVLRLLRVCWQNPENRYNCGLCEKCIRTMINLETAGKLAECTTFDAALEPARIAEMRIPYDLVYFDEQENLRVLKQHGRRDALVIALETSLGRYQSVKLARELSEIEQLPPSPELSAALNQNASMVLQSLADYPATSFKRRLVVLVLRLLGKLWKLS